MGSVIGIGKCFLALAALDDLNSFTEIFSGPFLKSFASLWDPACWQLLVSVSQLYHTVGIENRWHKQTLTWGSARVFPPYRGSGGPQPLPRPNEGHLKELLKYSQGPQSTDVTSWSLAGHLLLKRPHCFAFVAGGTAEVSRTEGVGTGQPAVAGQGRAGVGGVLGV